jgi:hypothetical protein
LAFGLSARAALLVQKVVIACIREKNRFSENEKWTNAWHPE